MEEEIKKYLKTSFIGRNIYYFDSLPSTNVKATEIARKVEEGTIVISEEQTHGKGRLGRIWISPKGKGIWLSIILKPQIHLAKVSNVTLIGAAAVNRALKDMGIESYIKWPNDIIINERKLAGILTEISFDNSSISYIIMGIGINVNLSRKDFDDSLQGKAISLKEVTRKEVNKVKLLASVLNHFEKFYIPYREKEDMSETIKVSRQESILIGKQVRIIERGIEKRGKALDIDNNGQLIIQYEDGSIGKLFSGEVSVRGKNAYI